MGRAALTALLLVALPAALAAQTPASNPAPTSPGGTPPATTPTPGVAPTPAPAGGAPSAPLQTEEQRKKAEEDRATRLTALERQIRWAPSSERKAGIRHVKTLNETERPRFIPILMEYAAKDLDYTIRENCLRTLADMSAREAEDVYVAALADANRDVLRAAVYALTRVQTPKALTAFDELLKKEDYTTNNQVLISIINLIGEMKHKTPAALLREKAEATDTHNEVRLAITLYFGRAGVTEMQDYLLKTLQNDQLDATTRGFAANSIGRLGDVSHSAALKAELEKIRALSNPRDRANLSPFKLQLLSALARLGDPSVEPELFAAARDDDARVRLRAVRQISDLKLETARALLEYIAEKDSSAPTRRAAKAGLEKLNGGGGGVEEEGDEEPTANEGAGAGG